MDEYANTNPIRDKIVSFFLIVYLLFFLVMGFLGLSAFQGFTEPLDTIRFWTFGILILLFIILIILKIAVTTFLKDLPFAKYIYIPIHDPELGFFKSIQIISNPIQLFAVSVIFFTILGFIGAAYPQSSAYLFPISAGQEPQQTTEAGKLLFGFFNAPAENAFLYVIIFFGMSILLYYARKYNFPLISAIIIGLIVFAPIAGFIWGRIHVGVSGSDELRTLGNTIFGMEGAILTIATGSIIPFEVYHVINNLFQRIKTLFGNDILRIVFILLIPLEIGGFGLVVYGTRRIKVLMQQEG